MTRTILPLMHVTSNHKLCVTEILFMILFFIINLFIFVVFSTSYPASNISFFANFFFLCMFLIYLLFTKYSIFSTVFFVFFYIFLWLAPLLQTYQLRYPNTMHFDERLVVYTNLVCALFGVLFLCTRLYFNGIKHKESKFNNTRYSFDKNTFYILFIISIIILTVFRNRIFRFSLLDIEVQALESATSLILNRFIFYIPLFLPAYVILNKDMFKRNYILFLVLSIVITIIFQNPLNARRNTLGPIYLSYIYLYYRNRINSNLKSVILLIGILLFGFTLAASITHTRGITSFADVPAHLSRSVNQYDIASELRKLHFDAWSEIMATIRYVQVHGPTYGEQLMGVLLFFVPRSVWPNKPIGSGHHVAENLLMVEHTMWFTNLSNPLPSEGYINFGIIGVALFTIVLGIASVKMDEYHKYSDIRKYISIYVAIYMTFLIRGDLMSSFSYLLGAMVAIYYFPKFIYMLFNRGSNVKYT